MAYIFGPVPSRRLGKSLGIDLIPAKTCTYDCLYCQVGKTTRKTLHTEAFAPLQEIFKELQEKLRHLSPDTITLSGSGEPTLHQGIGELISFIRGHTEIPTAIITNGSLLYRQEIRRRILHAHMIMPTLSSAFEETFQAIHRPHGHLRLSRVIEGLIALRSEYKGLLLLEVPFLAGFNDSDEEVDALKKTISEIAPDKIHLNTVVRPPSEPNALPLDRKRLEEIMIVLGGPAEIIAETPLEAGDAYHGEGVSVILEMAKRRPVRITDIAHGLGMDLKDVEGLIKGLRAKNLLRIVQHEDDVYYFTAEE
jgi:wyosine [tRNA(Phe)-imidazoG37] synthetase (radical SAM superfamily)